MDELENEFGEPVIKKASLSVKELLRKYLSYWPLFIVSLVIFIGGAYLYLRKATPKFYASTLLLVKGDKPEGGAEDLIANALTARSSSNNIENELQLMRSQGLMERIVKENEFNISYFLLGRIKATDVYYDAPFRLVMQTNPDSSKGFTLLVKKLNTNSATIEFGPKADKKVVTLPWNTPYKINGRQFVLTPKAKDFDVKANYMTIWSPIGQTASDINGKISVDWLDKKTTIIKVSIVIENLNRGVEILNALTKEYDRAELEEKNLASRNTIRFIDDRLEIIANELNGVEGSLENFQGRQDLVDVASQSGQAFDNSNNVSKDILDINIKKGVVQQIQSYFNNPNNSGKLVPSSLGIDDPTLGNLIGKYNELELTKQKEKPLLANNSLMLKDLDNQINDIKGSIIENLQNITKNLNLQQGSLEVKNSQYRDFLSSLPRKERAMQEIKRKQSITEGLYLYLLQKREEASIKAGATNVSIYKQIDKASGMGPVEPNPRNINIVAVLLGLLLPVGFIALGDKINDKITSREEVLGKLPGLPLLGELGSVPKKKARGIIILNRDLIGEQFRLIRTNLSLVEKNKDKQVTLVTSSGMGEGKSLISLNLAAVLAVPGKKVALLEFDLRKPGITQNLGYSNVKGLSDYLTGKTIDLSEIYQVSTEIETLHIYPAGAIPLNPGDLLLNENMDPLFDVLKRRYDYIIVDTPPVGLVSDAFILNKYSNASVYVFRQRYTLKKQLEFVKDIVANNRLHQMGIVINDMKVGGKYGNTYGAPQNYNYTYGQEQKKSIWKRMFPSAKA